MARERGGVIVVGGAGQIGSAVVTHYLEGGIAVAVVDKKPAEMNPAPGRGAQLHKIIADVTRTEDLSRASSDLARLGWVPRHIVSLAGGALDQEFNCLIDTDETTIRESIELNLTSHILLIREFLPLLEFGHTRQAPDATDRSITLVSSINALRDYGLPAYSAAKAGMFGFIRAMAPELGTQGIRINAVVPGTVETGVQTQPKDLQALRRNTALGRLTSPSDIADAILAISHTMTAVTGQYLVVDCGQTVATHTWRLSEGSQEAVS